jgi:hypothetical protein
MDLKMSLLVEALVAVRHAALIPLPCLVRTCFARGRRDGRNDLDGSHLNLLLNGRWSWSWSGLCFLLDSLHQAVDVGNKVDATWAFSLFGRAGLLVFIVSIWVCEELLLAGFDG